MLSQCKIFLRKFLYFWNQNPFHFCAILRIETQLRLKPESVTKDTEWRQRYSKVKMANFSFIRYVEQIVSFSSDLCLWKINFQNVTCGTGDKYRYHGWERSALRNIEITYTTILYTRSRKKLRIYNVLASCPSVAHWTNNPFNCVYDQRKEMSLCGQGN